MLVPTENGTGTVIVPEPETAEALNGHARVVAPVNGQQVGTLGRLHAAFEAARQDAEQAPPDDRPVLAVFSYEEPDSAPTRFVAALAATLAGRGVAVHVFTRTAFDLDVEGAYLHVLGEGEDACLLDRVHEFTHRACNAFLRRFQGATAPITLMGCEWSAVPALSILRGIKDLNTILSLHSLERQRSDMKSDLSQQIEAIELTGLRETRTVLVHEPATAEVAKYWAPECADRITCVRSLFPTQRFNRTLDPGAIKARYQVGPIDPTILYLGDLDERYGPDLLVKAMPPVLKNHPQARLVIVGDGAEYWPLRVYARYLLLEHAVRLPGHVGGDALDELIQAADIIAVPSRETTPWWPILAGWAGRRPVIATHTAAPGLLEHERDSILFYPNVNSCVWGIERVLFDADLGRTIATNGSRKLGERFGWGAVAAQVQELMATRAAR